MIVVVCFLLATPAAYLSAAGWLENFAYRLLVGVRLGFRRHLPRHLPDRFLPELAHGE